MASRMAIARIPCTSGRKRRSPGGVPASTPVVVSGSVAVDITLVVMSCRRAKPSQPSFNPRGHRLTIVLMRNGIRAAPSCGQKGARWRQGKQGLGPDQLFSDGYIDGRTDDFGVADISDRPNVVM